MKRLLFAFAFAAVLSACCENNEKALEERVESVLAQMTLDE